MKIGISRKAKGDAAPFAASKPAKNMNKRSGTIIILIVVTALLITWVWMLGVKATSTVSVVMLSQSVYKNQQITTEMIQPYDMVKAEFEKYSIVNEGGQAARRVVLWDERDKVIGTYAAYPLQANTLLEKRAIYKSRVDNSDSVLYSFPGKEIVALSIGVSDLQTFKTFLQPGDRVNITAIYTEEEEVPVVDSYGGSQTQKVETVRTEVAFQDIMVADLLNNAGDSILDIYEDYNDKTVSQQYALDNNEAFQDSVTPSSLIVALTPEEKDLYFYYLSKRDVVFKMSLPQRVE